MTFTVALAHPHVGADDIEAARPVLRSRQLAQGSEAAAFEDEFSSLVAGRPCIAVSSGTDALHLGLRALGIGPGGEVVLPSLTFGATAHAGATPVFADISPETFALGPDAVAAAITPRTAALLPVHLFGHPAAMHQLIPLAERNGLAIVEDAAQAVAASHEGTPVGALGGTPRHSASTRRRNSNRSSSSADGNEFRVLPGQV